MDMQIVKKLKSMSREEIGQMHVSELSPLDAIWNLVEYIKELETQYVPVKDEPKIPGLEG